MAHGWAITGSQQGQWSQRREHSRKAEKSNSATRFQLLLCVFSIVALGAVGPIIVMGCHSITQFIYLFLYATRASSDGQLQYPSHRREHRSCIHMSQLLKQALWVPKESATLLQLLLHTKTIQEENFDCIMSHRLT